MLTNIKIDSTKDYDDVVETVEKYVEGLRLGRVATISNTFHQDAVMYGYTNGGLIGDAITSKWN